MLISCTFSSDLISTIDGTALPDDWRRSPASAELAVIGDEWSRSRRSAVLDVPSAIIERERNYLINPHHPDFERVELSPPEPFIFDLRLLDEVHDRA